VVSRTVRIALVAGIAAAVASAQSGIVSWGYPNGGQVAPPLPPGLTYVDIDAGGAHTLALRSDGQIVAWGANGAGACDVPPLPPGLEYVEVEAGESHSVARRSDGSVVAWGWDAFSLLAVPPLPPGLTYVEVAAGSYHTVALRSDGSVVAWGQNDYRQCDVPAFLPGRTAVAVAAGSNTFSFAGFSLALLDDGSVVAWGATQRPPHPPPGLTYVEIAANEGYALARLSDGSVIVWGDCESSGVCDVPDLPSGVTYTGIAAGNFHALAFRSDGAVVAWGPNSHGECDVPSLPPGLRYVEISAGNGFSAGRVAGCPTCELPFCLGDGGERSDPCPCGNYGASGRGCQNSASTGGAQLSVSGSVELDTVVLEAIGQPASAAGLFLQGSAVLGTPMTFGDGTRCIGGAQKRLAMKSAMGGASSYPGVGDPSIRTRSAALGDPIAPGSYRYYQVVYRDPDPTFCNPPSTVNASNAVMVAW
jgi:hypothetical protein